jgi:hypothetical protein
VSARTLWTTMPLKGVLARWDALVIRWDLLGDERSSLLGQTLNGPILDATSYRLVESERRMRMILELEEALSNIFTDEQALRAWLRRENRGLGGRTPIQAIAQSPQWIEWLTRAVGTAS